VRTANFTCAEGERKCPTSYSCISPDRFCDGRNDCGDLSDEEPSVCRKRLQLIVYFHCPVPAGAKQYQFRCHSYALMHEEEVASLFRKKLPLKIWEEKRREGEEYGKENGRKSEICKSEGAVADQQYVPLGSNHILPRLWNSIL